MNLSAAGAFIVSSLIFLSSIALADDAAPILSIDSLKPPTAAKLRVTSPAFKGNQLAEEFTRNGQNKSPALSWSKGPKETKAYAILVQDVSASKPEEALHWVVYNIPGSITSLPQDIPADARLASPAGALQGLNVRGMVGWIGPKPPMGVAHSYHFQVFAVDSPLEVDPAAADGKTVVAALGGHVLASGETAASYETPQPPYDRHDLTGIWFSTYLRSGFKVAEISFTPDYADRLKANQAATLAHPSPYGVDPLKCLPLGLVATATGGILPFEIYSNKGEILVDKEAVNTQYRIYLNRGHKPADEIAQTFFGDSVGRWDGDTLVVDSVGLGGSKTLDGVIPHSDALHVVQRISRVHYDTIENQITVDDAKAFTKPATTKVTYKLKPDWEISEMTCTNERDAVNEKGEPTFKPAAQ